MINSVNKNARGNRKVLAIAVIIILIVVGLPMYVFGTWLTSYRDLSPKFCTLEDETYQTIVSHVNEWIELHNKSNDYPAFYLSSGEKFIVNFPITDPNVVAEYFFVIVGTERNEPFGRAGYIYGTPSSLDQRYQIRHLGKNVYCYKLA